MTWTLLIFVLASSPAIQTVPMRSKEACLTAQSRLADGAARASFVCISSDDGETIVMAKP